MNQNNHALFYKFILMGIVILGSAVTAFVCDKEVSVSPPPAPVEYGIIKLQSNPEGATIYLNGRNTGRITPDSLIYLDYDLYQVTLKKQYFRDTSIYLRVDEGIIVDTSIDYLGNPLMYGNLNINSSPNGALVIINDSATGYYTPSVFNHLQPGEYSVRMRKTGYRDAVLSRVPVESNKTKSVFSNLIDTTVWVDFQTSNSSIPTNVLSCLTADQNSVIWIGTAEYGILKFDGSNFTEFNETNSPLPDNSINCIGVDPMDKIWIGTDNGLAAFDRNNWMVYTTENSGLPNNSIKALAFEGSNIVWIGTSVGLVKFDGSWNVYTISSALSNWVTTICVDQAGTKWLSVTDTSFGVVSFNTGSFTNYPIGQYHYLTKQILSSAADPGGGVWFGCNGYLGALGGLSYYDGNNFSNLIISSAILIKNIFISNSGTKWVSTNDGLYEIKGVSQITHFSTVNSPIPSSDIRGSVEDNNGIVWMATGTAGLVKYKGANSGL